MNVDLSHSNFDVDGFQYTWKDGVFSITLGQRKTDGYRTAYFHPMASVSEYAVSTSILQNEQSSRREDHGNDFKVNFCLKKFDIMHLHIRDLF